MIHSLIPFLTSLSLCKLADKQHVKSLNCFFIKKKKISKHHCKPNLQLEPFIATQWLGGTVLEF